MMSESSLVPEEVAMLLHELRLRGWIERGDDPLVVQGVKRGLILRRDRRLVLTHEGREAHAAWARVATGSSTEADLERGYARFLELNRRLLKLCTDWQVLPGNVPNDHSDVTYEWSIVDRLVSLDERAGPLVRELGEVLERLRVYRPRLRAAADRVQKGEHDWILSPRQDSYHTVWMQFHEDLLLALGRDRSDEEQD